MNKRILLLLVLSLTSVAAYAIPGPDPDKLPQRPAAAANRCDLNGNGAPDAPDIQFLVQGIIRGNSQAAHDINRDSRVNILDIQVLVNTILGVRACPN